MFIVSADSHIDLQWLPFTLFTDNASEALRDRMPFVTDTPNGAAWVTRKGVNMGLAVGMGSTGRPYIKGASHRGDRMAEAGLYTDGAKGILRLTDPDLRIKDQDLDGVSAEVLYGMLFASTQVRDVEVAWEMARIYNDWLIDFCSHHPNRLLGLASIPSHSADLAAAEIRRVTRRGGIRGFDISGAEEAGMPLYHDDWTDFWRAIDESGLPVHFHTLGPRPRDTSRYTKLDINRAKAEELAHFQIDRSGLVMRQTILGGIFETYPNIKMVISECGIGWIPFLLERMDQGWIDQYRPLLSLKRRPSEYWTTNCYATYQMEDFGTRVIHDVGVGNVMWASDFPHPDGLWPDSLSVINSQYKDLDPASRQKVISENAVNLYKLDVPPATPAQPNETRASV